VQETLDAGQDRSNVIRGAPSVLQDVQTQFSVCIHVWVEHPREELHSWWLVWVRLVERERESERAIFEWGVPWD
jgi:hypothetical protein